MATGSATLLSYVLHIALRENCLILLSVFLTRVIGAIRTSGYALLNRAHADVAEYPALLCPSCGHVSAALTFAVLEGEANAAVYSTWR